MQPFKIPQADIQAVRKETTETKKARRKTRNTRPAKVKVDYTNFAIPKLSVKLEGSEYTELVDSVYYRDGFRCTNPKCCHALSGSNILTPHHLIKRSLLRLDIPENLISVCQYCHRLIDDMQLEIDWVVPDTFLAMEGFLETWRTRIQGHRL